MARSIVVPFERSSEFSPDPLTEVIRSGARHLLGAAVQAEVSAFIAEHAHLDTSKNPTPALNAHARGHTRSCLQGRNKVTSNCRLTMDITKLWA